jgi:glutamine cyclotransferase
MSMPPTEPAESQQRWLVVSGVLALLVLIALFVFAYLAFTQESKSQTRLDQALAAQDVQLFDFVVLEAYPHDPQAFTEGLVVSDGILFEGTGLNEESWLERRSFPSGKQQIRHELSDSDFGEGVTVLGDKVFQLTYKSETGFVYDRKNLAPLNSFQYEGEGWGLTTDGEQLIMSNGSATLRHFDPKTFQTTRETIVRDSIGELTGLNELEYHNGVIYANVFPTDLIAIIDAHSGRVTGWVDLAGLEPTAIERDRENVANGIAVIPKSGALLVTGKRWTSMFAIQIIPSQGQGTGPNPA